MTKVALVVVGVLVLLGGGAAYAAYRYDGENANRILPGVSIDGVAVGGMTGPEATAAVIAEAGTRLSADLAVRAGGRSWHVTPQDLGMRADVTAAVDEALSVSDRTSFFQRVWHRLRQEPVAVSVDLSYRTNPGQVRAFVGKVQRSVAVASRDAAISLVDGRVVFRHSKTGRSLDAKTSTSMILGALRSAGSVVALPVSPVPPEVSENGLGPTILVDISQNRLSLYHGFKLERSYPVATAMPGFTTPTGEWKVVAKTENPAWHNPDPTGWGAGEPLVIPPGPTNPLGTRALYLDAPGIRIHGTPDTSSVGTYASHGCIRMTIVDSEALYPLAPVGTKVIIFGTRA